MSKCLIYEAPMMIIPSLAVKIGFNEAIVLQRIHFWLSSSKHIIEGRKWIFNTYKDWQKQMPFWSESTIKRSIHSLEKQGYLISANWNRTKMDKTKWYTIEYERMVAFEEFMFELSMDQDEPSTVLDWVVEESNLNQAIPESTSRITSEENLPVVEIIHYLNEKTNTSYKPSINKTQEIIRARIREGYTVDDFKQVIDIKTAEWLPDPRMYKYLKPEILFGTKFESYLNQKPFKTIFREEDINLDDEEGDV